MYVEVNKTWPCKIYSLGEKVGHMIREMGEGFRLWHRFTPCFHYFMDTGYVKFQSQFPQLQSGHNHTYLVQLLY